MKLGLRQFIAAYIAACLLLAGVAGLSPELHNLIEHGGKGSPHVHGWIDSPQPTAASHRHADGEEHFHAPTDAAPASGDGTSSRLFVHSSDAFPGADVLVARFWQRLQDWLSQQESTPAAPDAGNEHHHDSLASSLTGGLVDQSDPVVSFEILVLVTVSLRFSPSADRVHPFDLEPRFAPRGPPAQQG